VSVEIKKILAPKSLGTTITFERKLFFGRVIINILKYIHFNIMEWIGFVVGHLTNFFLKQGVVSVHMIKKTIFVRKGQRTTGAIENWLLCQSLAPGSCGSPRSGYLLAVSLDV